RAVEQRRDAVEADLGRHADSDENAFVALNTALFDDGAVIYVADGVVAERPIVLQFVSTGGAERHATNPRILVVLGRAAAATIVESYNSDGGGERLTNSVAEIVLGEGSSLKHYRIVEEGERSFHIGT